MDNIELIIGIISCIIAGLLTYGIFLAFALGYHYISINYEDLHEEIDFFFDYIFRGGFGLILKIGIWGYLGIVVFLGIWEIVYDLIKPLFINK